MNHRARSRGRAIWAICTGLLGVATVVAVLGPSRNVVWVSPFAVFAIVTVAATLCVLAAVAVIGAGHRRDIAEVGVLGTGLFVVSILPLVHGLTAPGVLYGPNEAVRTSVFLSLPGALVAWSPLVARHTAFGRWSARHWRLWSAAFVGCSTLVAAVLLLWPQVDLAPTGASALTVAVVAAEIVATIALSRQQLALYEISERPSALVASLGFVLLAATALVWLGTPPFSAGWWLVHGLDIAGVFGGCLAAYRCHRLERPVTDLLAPVLVLDPLAALAVGLSPAVHRFVAALQHKDPITRDHVVRTAALALRVGQRLRTPGSRAPQPRPRRVAARHRQTEHARRTAQRARPADSRRVSADPTTPSTAKPSCAPSPRWHRSPPSCEATMNASTAPATPTH